MAWIQQNLNLIYIVGGMLALFLGGEGLIRGAVALADKLRLPKLLIGLTVVGFGTSMPELMVALQAVGRGAPDVAIGNIIGSNTANILLIACAGALVMPLATQTRGLRRDVVVMVLAAAALVWFAFQGNLPTRAGQGLVAALGSYLLLVFLQERKWSAASPKLDIDVKPMSLPVALAYVSGGLIFLILGADYLVRGATAIATSMGVSEAVIGLTLVALGTSLPELTVSVMSSLKGQNEVSLGNVIGSNIFNILGILGITAMVHPVVISPAFLKVDLIVMAGASLWLAFLIFASPKIGRLSALLGLLVYAAYMTWLALGADGIGKWLPVLAEKAGLSGL